MNDDFVVVTAAVTGSIHTPSMSPFLPLTVDQIVSEVRRVADAGAAVAHIHVRDPRTGEPSSNLALFREVGERVKATCDIVLNFTTGGVPGQLPEDRIEVIRELRPEFASFNAGSMNFSFDNLDRPGTKWLFDWEQPFVQSSSRLVALNSVATLRDFADTFQRAGTVPEIEIYDLGMISNIARLVGEGRLGGTPSVQFVLGINGGAEATVENLVILERAARERLPGVRAWSVAAAGRQQMPMCAAALAMGGHVRVGLEDALYIDRGELAKSNASQVARVVSIAALLGRRPASPAEVRALIGLKGSSNVGF